MSPKPSQTVGDLEGPWVDPETVTGLIRRCRDHWNVPVRQLSNEILATYLRQKLGLRLTIPEAQRRLNEGFVDGTELYDEELAAAVKSASKV
jgi:hypothetical protein